MLINIKEIKTGTETETEAKASYAGAACEALCEAARKGGCLCCISVQTGSGDPGGWPGFSRGCPRGVSQYLRRAWRSAAYQARAQASADSCAAVAKFADTGLAAA